MAEGTEKQRDRERLKGGGDEIGEDGVMMNERRGTGESPNHSFTPSFLFLYFSFFISLSARPREVGQRGI